jgi:hypothetical protein
MATLEEQKANRRKWVEALRSGEYEQAIRRLHREGAHCCLGVACRVAGLTDEELGGYANLTHQRRWGKVRDFFGLRDGFGSYNVDDGYSRCLTDDNDEGKSFAQIADIIESEPDGLFITPEAS